MVRLTGLSGTGKTRLLEALFDPAIGDQALDPALAIYADIGHEAPQPSASQLAAQLARRASAPSCFWTTARGRPTTPSPRSSRVLRSPLSLITVDLDIRDERPEHTDVFRLQSASAAVIESLLEQRYPALSQAIRRRIAEFSDGNARIAILAAGNVGPETNLADLGDEGLFERLFHQRKPTRRGPAASGRGPRPGLLLRRRDHEGRRGGTAYSRADGRARCSGAPACGGELMRRDIVQSRGRWRAILPQPLANWLAKRALENQPALENCGCLLGCGNQRLLQSFAHRLSYLHDSPAAQRIAEAWLAPGGLLSDLGETWPRVGPDPRIDSWAPGAGGPEAPPSTSSSGSSMAQPWTSSGARHSGSRTADVPLAQAGLVSGAFPPRGLLLSRFVQAELGDLAQPGHPLPGRAVLAQAVRDPGGPESTPGAGRRIAGRPGPSVAGERDDCAARHAQGRHFTSAHDFSFGGYAFDFGWAAEDAGGLPGLVRRRPGDRDAAGAVGLAAAGGCPSGDRRALPGTLVLGQVCDQLEAAVLAHRDPGALARGLARGTEDHRARRRAMGPTLWLVCEPEGTAGASRLA